MSNLAPFKNTQQPGLPLPPKGDTIARFGTYLEAQKAVDYLSDNHFPVQAVTIVGVDLQMVERVTGRLTYGRVAVAGLLSGAWFGLFVGLLLLFFSNNDEGGGVSVFAAMIIGAAFGGLFGLISYSFTGGRRDFTSTSQIVAGEYRVLCLTEQAGQAMQLLGQLAREGGPRSNDSGPSAPATAPVTPASGDAVQPFPGETPAGVTPEPGAPPVEPVTGPTYSEMIDRKKAEDREREDRQRQERQQAEVQERAEAERAQAEQKAERDRAEAQSAPTEVHTPVQTPTTQVPIQDPPA
jgi:hypothetical protein